MHRTLLLLTILATLLSACHKSNNPTPDTNNPTPPVAKDTTITVDCIPGASGCSAINIQGDAPYVLPSGGASTFSGYADPSIRKDPASNKLYLAYSWPNIHIDNGVTTSGIDAHLAYSTDSGRSFTFIKSLWPSVAMNNPANASQAGYLEMETPNLLPVTANGVTTWYAARLNYFIPRHSGFVFSSYHISVLAAATPEDLSTAPYARLGAGITDPAWNINQNLAALEPNLSDIGFWNEPSLYYENGTLYLTLVGFVYSNGVPTNHKVCVFATTPSGAPSSWQWSYKGQLAGTAEAADLGAQFLTQVDIARSRDGAHLLMICTPDKYVDTAQDYNHMGCKVLEVQSMATATLARDSTGKLKVRAAVTVSDAGPLGNAASTYYAASATGLIITRRQKSSTENHPAIWFTGIRP